MYHQVILNFDKNLFDEYWFKCIFISPSDFYLKIVVELIFEYTPVKFIWTRCFSFYYYCSNYPIYILSRLVIPKEQWGSIRKTGILIFFHVYDLLSLRKAWCLNYRGFWGTQPATVEIFKNFWNFSSNAFKGLKMA